MPVYETIVAGLTIYPNSNARWPAFCLHRLVFPRGLLLPQSKAEPSALPPAVYLGTVEA